MESNENPQANPGGVVKLADGRFVPEAEHAQAIAHAEAMNAPDPYVDPDRAVSVYPPVTEEEQEAVVEEAPAEEAPVTEEVTNDLQIEPEAEAEAEEAPAEDSLEEIAEEARAYSDLGYSDEQIDAWTELSEEDRTYTNPDGSVTLHHIDVKNMTDNQHALLYREVMQTGALSPQHAEKFAEGYGVTPAVVNQYIESWRAAEIAKAQDGAAADAAKLEMSSDEYTAMTQWYNQLPDEKQMEHETQLSNPSLRDIALMGIREMYKEATAAQAPAPTSVPQIQSTLPTNVRPVQQVDGTWVLKRVS